MPELSSNGRYRLVLFHGGQINHLGFNDAIHQQALFNHRFQILPLATVVPDED